MGFIHTLKKQKDSPNTLGPTNNSTTPTNKKVLSKKRFMAYGMFLIIFLKLGT
jgi:hypothetical protein